MSELRTIQAARAIAANLVVFSHLFFVEAKYTAGSTVLPAFTLYGIAGVDLFFVISGFIMVAVAGRDRGPIEFLWRRATRIYPTYWLVSLTVLAICTWSTTVGSLIPIAAERVGVDPAVLSAPLITTLVDATGLVIYFTIAKMILHL